MEKKILILGSNGFSGQHLQKYLKEEKKNKFEVFCSDINKPIIKSSKFFKADLVNYINVKNLIRETKPDYIINCSGTYNNSDFKQYYNINVLISNNIYHSLLNIKNLNPKILIIGSAAEYGFPGKLPIKETQKLNPVSFYGWLKVIQTYQALYYYKNFNLQILIARPFNLLGPGLSDTLSISSFCNQVYKNKKGEKSIIKAGNLNTKRDFIDIRDTIRAYIDIVLYGKAGEVYNICFGKSWNLKNIVYKIMKLSGFKVNLIYDKNRTRKNDVSDIYGSYAKINKLSGWKPEISLTSSLQSMIEYAYKNRK